jgi:hypothetical protein
MLSFSCFSSCFLALFSRQTASAKSGQNIGGLARWKEALEILQKGKGQMRASAGQNIPACVVLNAARHGLVRKEAFCRKAF